MNENRLDYDAIMNAPVSERIGPRGRRRTQVVALYASYPLICAANALRAYAGGSALRYVALALLLAGLIVGLYGFFALMGRTFVNAPNIRESALDERQRHRRSQAIASASPITGLFIAIGLLYSIFADELFPALRNAAASEALWWGAFLLATTLPSAIIAWTEPDPLPADGP